PVEVPATRIRVIGDFGDEVRKQVRRCRIRVGVKLRTQGGVEGRRKDNFRTLAGELLGVFQGEGPGKFVIRVPCHAKLGCAGKVGAYVVVTVFIECGKDITGIRRNPNPVHGQQAPALSTQELPLSALEIDPVEPQTVGVAIRGYKDVGRVVAIEVELNETGYVGAGKLGVYLEVEAGVLAGRAKFAQMPLHRVAEGNGPPVGASHVAGIGRA